MEDCRNSIHQVLICYHKFHWWQGLDKKILDKFLIYICPLFLLGAPFISTLGAMQCFLNTSNLSKPGKFVFLHQIYLFLRQQDAATILIDDVGRARRGGVIHQTIQQGKLFCNRNNQLSATNTNSNSNTSILPER